MRRAEEGSLVDYDENQPLRVAHDGLKIGMVRRRCPREIGKPRAGFTWNASQLAVRRSRRRQRRDGDASVRREHGIAEILAVHDV